AAGTGAGGGPARRRAGGLLRAWPPARALPAGARLPRTPRRAGVGDAAQRQSAARRRRPAAAGIGARRGRPRRDAGLRRGAAAPGGRAVPAVAPGGAGLPRAAGGQPGAAPAAGGSVTRLRRWRRPGRRAGRLGLPWTRGGPAMRDSNDTGGPGAPTRPGQPSRVRAGGRWQLGGRSIKDVVGSGIYLLPAGTIVLLGAASLWAVTLAGLAVSLLVLCYAQAASWYDHP